MPESHMEVGCPEVGGLELQTPNPGSKNTPKACPTCNPATSHTCPAERTPRLTQTGEMGEATEVEVPIQKL